MIYIKYHLHKDGSPIWDIVDNELEANKRIDELKVKGYKPFVDRAMSERLNKAALNCLFSRARKFMPYRMVFRPFLENFMIPYAALPNRDMDLIGGCVDRAVPLLPSLLRCDIELSLCKAHTAKPLNLAGLLASRDKDFVHDVAGIVRHVDRVTGVLGQCYCPRAGHS
jgi:hypothetical protein